jgi:hypothetical protein
VERGSSVGSAKEIPACDRPAAWRPDAAEAEAEARAAERAAKRENAYVPTLLQLLTFMAKASMVDDEEVLDALDSESKWESYKRRFFLGSTPQELVRESHWAAAWGRDKAKEAIAERRLENPLLRFRPKPGTEPPTGAGVARAEDLSRFASGLDAVHADYVAAYQPWKARQRLQRQREIDREVAATRKAHHRRGSQLAAKARPTILSMMYDREEGGAPGGGGAAAWTAADEAAFGGRPEFRKRSSTGSMGGEGSKARSRRNIAKLKAATRKAITARFALSALTAARTDPAERVAQNRARSRRMSDPALLV